MGIKSKFASLRQHPHRKKIVGSIIIILCTTIIISHPEIIPGYTNHEMEWDITVGSRLTYEITCTPIPVTITEVPEYGFWPLNGTEIVFEVTALPSIPRFTTRSNFQVEIIDFSKVECSFKNGSSLPQDYDSQLNALISGSILPVNGSSLLDQLFDDFQNWRGKTSFSDAAPIGDYYYLQISTYNATNLMVGFSSMITWTSGHAVWGSSWYGTVPFQTSIPQNGTILFFGAQSCGSALSERIHLELIDVDLASE